MSRYDLSSRAARLSFCRGVTPGVGCERTGRYTVHRLITYNRKGQVSRVHRPLGWFGRDAKIHRRRSVAVVERFVSSSVLIRDAEWQRQVTSLGRARLHIPDRVCHFSVAEKDTKENGVINTIQNARRRQGGRDRWRLLRRRLLRRRLFRLVTRRTFAPWTRDRSRCRCKTRVRTPSPRS